MKEKNKIFEYLIYKFKNNYKDFDLDINYNIINLFYRSLDNNGNEKMSINLRYYKNRLIFNNIKYIISFSQEYRTINNKYGLFNKKYWLLLKFIKKSLVNNNIEILKNIEHTDKFFTEQELRNLKIKNISL